MSYGKILFELFPFVLHLHASLRVNKKKEKTKEQKIRPKKRELHELLYTEIVKYGTIRLT